MKLNLPDAIVTWPRHLDYPLFRKCVKENRDKFNKLIIVFTDMNVRDPDYRLYVREAMKEENILFLDCLPAEAKEDWRNKAVNMALTVSDSEWVWFWEEDFIPVPELWREVKDLMQRVDVFGRYQERRLHPCCLFIKRKLLDRTSKDFSAYPDKGMDHFGLIQKWLESHDIITGVIFAQYGYHMNGLSQNLHMLQTGLEPNYAPPEFKKYVQDCLTEDIPPDMRELFEGYLNK